MIWNLLLLFVFLWAVFAVLGDDLNKQLETFIQSIKDLLEAKPTVGGVNTVGLILIFLLALAVIRNESGLSEWLFGRNEQIHGGAIKELGVVGLVLAALFLCLKAMRGGRR